MNPSLIDPNNHAPEVSPDDGWDDAEGFSTVGGIAPAVLPPRRTVSDRAPNQAPETAPSGLRIEPNVARREAGDDSAKLDVQEINSVVRLEQTGPSPEKVPRLVTFHERPKKESRTKKLNGESGEWGLVRNFSQRWIILTGTGVTALIILSLMMLPQINKANAARSAPAERDLKAIESEKIDGMDAIEAMVKKQPEAESIFSAYAKASVVDEVIALVRDPDKMGDVIRKSWKPLGLEKNWSPPPDSTWEIRKSGKESYGILTVTLPDFTTFTACFLNRDNHLLLDWKASTVFGTATFEELSKGSGDTSEIRGLIAPSNFYTAVWSEDEYQCYQLLEPSGDRSVWCYARRIEAAGGACEELFKGGEIIEDNQTNRKITVRLDRGPEGSAPNQWLIRDVIRTDWVTP